jgi:hypothetical protein
MRPTTALAALSVLLAGCTYHNHQHVIDQVRPLEFASPAEPQQLVRCVTLNARSFSGAYSADWSELVRPLNYEAVVFRTYNPVYIYNPIIVAHASPAPGGSRLLLYFTDGQGPRETDDWVVRLRKGCDAVRTVAVPVIPAGVVVPAAPAPAPAPAPAGRPTRG